MLGWKERRKLTRLLSEEQSKNRKLEKTELEISKEAWKRNLDESFDQEKKQLRRQLEILELELSLSQKFVTESIGLLQGENMFGLLCVIHCTRRPQWILSGNCYRYTNARWGDDTYR
ncbi:hypothetical protein SPFM20_00152 [Salmonella phage SPFM20]|nr:hypothetical protein SPFM20_00152 [Salmonella phage SPFM20]